MKFRILKLAVVFALWFLPTSCAWFGFHNGGECRFEQTADVPRPDGSYHAVVGTQNCKSADNEPTWGQTLVTITGLDGVPADVNGKGSPPGRMVFGATFSRTRATPPQVEASWRNGELMITYPTGVQFNCWPPERDVVVHCVERGFRMPEETK
jgi:hypothetical protein